ncbi:tripartite motif-containing protein 3 [Lingula anatina]|uniref:Tripartite motif-containing protein 3 n=1 Tax=Lingula anatina TaxID=7574 RepID=A0A1S3KIB8_LINAN|nr:tripartite motif-containing protein 3 [Lingula anatina]|eukprot:XP_013421961.1 tripartite motif-containing protein 3 [Lingula anatina]
MDSHAVCSIRSTFSQGGEKGMDEREKVTALLTEVYGSVHTIQSNLKKLHAMHTLLYMKRDIGKSAIRSCLQAMTAKLAQLQTELEVELENECAAKEEKLQGLSDLYVKRVEEVNNTCPKIEEFLLAGKEKELKEQYKALCEKLKNMLKATEKENLEHWNTSSWSTLEFVPLPSGLKKSDMGYIKCSSINPDTLMLSPPENGDFYVRPAGSLVTFKLYLPDGLEPDTASLRYLSGQLAPHGSKVPTEETRGEFKLDDSAAVITLSFQPQMSGTYQIHVHVYGQAIKGSPFKMVVLETATSEYEMPGVVKKSPIKSRSQWNGKSRPRVASSGLLAITRHITGEEDTIPKDKEAAKLKTPKFDASFAVPCFSGAGDGLANLKMEHNEDWVRDPAPSKTTDEGATASIATKAQTEANKTVTITWDDLKKFRMPTVGNKPALRKPLRKPVFCKSEPEGAVMNSEDSVTDSPLKDKKVAFADVGLSTESNEEPVKKNEVPDDVKPKREDILLSLAKESPPDSHEDVEVPVNASSADESEEKTVCLPVKIEENISHCEEKSSTGEKDNSNFSFEKEMVKSVIEQHRIDCPGKALKAELVLKFGHKGKELKDHLFFPIGVTTTKEGHFVVADHGNDMVKIFDRNGEHMLTIGSKQNNVFSRPSAVVVNDQGELFVKDSRMLQVYDLHGNLLRSFGKGDLNAPYGMALNQFGHLIVMDTCRQEPSLVVFTQDGRWMRKIAVPVLAGVHGSKCRFMDCYDDIVVVSDLGQSHMYIVKQQGGQVVKEFGGFGRRPGEFNEPSGVGIDAFGNIVVADSKNDRVQVFYPDGTFQCLLELSEPICRPSDLHLTEDGHLVIVNFLEHCVKVYKLHC